LKEESKQRVFENRVLRGIFGAKRDKVTRNWKKLHIEELNYLYYSCLNRDLSSELPKV
jgi:hypothetical protein